MDILISRHIASVYHRLHMLLISALVISNCLLMVSSTLSRRSLAEIANPVTDWEACGRQSKSYVCNPDHVITPAQADLLDAHLQSIRTSTSCPCHNTSHCVGEEAGYSVGVAIIKKMAKPVTAVDSSGHSNTNEGHATLMSSIVDEARDLARNLLHKWHLGQCNDGVLVLFSSTEKVLYTAVGSTAKIRLTDDIVGEIAMNVQIHRMRNTLLGLEKLLTSYQSVFQQKYVRTTHWNNNPEAAAVVGTSKSPTGTYPTLCTILISIFVVLCCQDILMVRQT